MATTVYIAASKVATSGGAFEYNDGLCPGNRRPRLWLVRSTGEVVPFEGATIPGVCNLLGSRYHKNGKWSSTTYQLRVGTAIPVHLLAPLHGKIWGMCFDWASAEQAFDAVCGFAVDSESFRAVFRASWPETADRFDAAETLPELE